jgi:hypothetical protein
MIYFVPHGDFPEPGKLASFRNFTVPIPVRTETRIRLAKIVRPNGVPRQQNSTAGPRFQAVLARKGLIGREIVGRGAA